MPLEAVLKDTFLVEPQLRKLSASYVDAKQAQDILEYDALTTCWSTNTRIACMRASWAADCAAGADRLFRAEDHP